jgi:hypothetical protein
VKWTALHMPLRYLRNVHFFASSSNRNAEKQTMNPNQEMRLARLLRVLRGRLAEAWSPFDGEF